jgi:small subunit ribosomal protein S20
LPKIKSAIKRVEVTERNRLRNASYKSSVRTSIKKFVAALALASQSPDEAKSAFSEATRKMDMAASKRIFHKNTVARYKSRMAKKLNHALAPSA